MLNLPEIRAAWSRGSRPGPTIHALCDEVADLNTRLHAAEVERNAALSQLHEQNTKLDAATLAVEALREGL